MPLTFFIIIIKLMFPMSSFVETMIASSHGVIIMTNIDLLPELGPQMWVGRVSSAEVEAGHQVEQVSHWRRHLHVQLEH